MAGTFVAIYLYRAATRRGARQVARGEAGKRGGAQGRVKTRQTITPSTKGATGPTQTYAMGPTSKISLHRKASQQVCITGEFNSPIGSHPARAGVPYRVKTGCISASRGRLWPCGRSAQHDRLGERSNGWQRISTPALIPVLFYLAVGCLPWRRPNPAGVIMSSAFRLIASRLQFLENLEYDCIGTSIPSISQER